MKYANLLLLLHPQHLTALVRLPAIPVAHISRLLSAIRGGLNAALPPPATAIKPDAADPALADRLAAVLTAQAVLQVGKGLAAARRTGAGS